MEGSTYSNDFNFIIQVVEDEQRATIKEMLLTLASHLPLGGKITDLKNVLEYLHRVGLITTEEVGNIFSSYEMKKEVIPH